MKDRGFDRNAAARWSAPSDGLHRVSPVPERPGDDDTLRHRTRLLLRQLDSGGSFGGSTSGHTRASEVTRNSFSYPPRFLASRWPETCRVTLSELCDRETEDGQVPRSHPHSFMTCGPGRLRLVAQQARYSPLPRRGSPPSSSRRSRRRIGAGATSTIITGAKTCTRRSDGSLVHIAPPPRLPRLQ